MLIEMYLFINPTLIEILAKILVKNILIVARYDAYVKTNNIVLFYKCASTQNTRQN